MQQSDSVTRILFRFFPIIDYYRASQESLVVKNLLANAGGVREVGLILGLDPLEEGIATHSSILTWRIP